MYYNIIYFQGDVLFNSWKEMFNGNGAYFSQNPRIYSFTGKNILTDFTWYGFHIRIIQALSTTVHFLMKYRAATVFLYFDAIRALWKFHCPEYASIISYILTFTRACIRKHWNAFDVVADYISH